MSGILKRLLPSAEDLAGMISPEMIAELMQSLGIDPAALMAEFDKMKAEVEGFKAGHRATLLHFDNRLNAIVSNQQRIIALLEGNRASLPAPITDNCVQMGVRETNDGPDSK